MNRKMGTIGTCLGLGALVVLAFGTASFATQSKSLTTASKGLPAQPAKTTNPHSSPMTPIEVAREVEQLERIKHQFEKSAGNDRASHSALAARHIQTAINEMKIEMQEDAYGKNSNQEGQPQSARSTTSAANATKAGARKN